MQLLKRLIICVANGVSMTGQKHILESARLRGQGNAKDALDEIEQNLDSFDDVTMVPALLQGIYAAEALGDKKKAESIAQELHTIDPDIPTLKKYLP